MKAIAFWFREGSSLLFAGYLILFAMVEKCLVCIPGNDVGMFVVAMAALIYLALQTAMAGFSTVGHDRPLLDFFFSLFPGIALLVIAVLASVGTIDLTRFEVLSLVVAGVATLIDVILNTQVIFKMNRLATDMVQMK